ncbi:MAG: hypothetical protein ACE149_19340 [Armatimonadota bacterium]
MPRSFGDIDGLISFLRSRKITEVTLSARVATTTSPGGEQIAFRGRIVVEAKYGRSGCAQYSEQVMPYVANTRSPDLPASAEHAEGLRAAQLALARQLRSYRGEYQAVVDSAKASVADRLARAGITIAEAELPRARGVGGNRSGSEAAGLEEED